MQIDDSNIHYARTSGASIAYQVVGDGPLDLVFVPAFESNLVYGWLWPRWREFYGRLSSFSRLILFDKRGTGLSDHTGGFPTLETRMEDLRAVLDAVGSHRTVVLGTQEGCGMACLFAATYPERVTALVLFQPVVRGGVSTPDQLRDREQFLDFNARLREHWGEKEFCDELLARESPSLAEDPQERIWFANWCRVSASPAAAYALSRMYFETDLGDVLPVVRVPTLVIYRGDFTESHARDVSREIPDARLVRVTGDDVWGIFLSPEIADEIERFVSGTNATPQEPERVLMTILFTDLVGSSARAAEIGDSAWKQLLGQHHALVRRELSRFRGNEVDTAGDGFFATFDGPARAIRCATAIRATLADLGFEVRAALHTGECELVDEKPAGIAVHAAARICATAKGGDVVVSSTVKDLVAGSGIVFEDQGLHSLRGVPGEWHLYRITDF